VVVAFFGNDVIDNVAVQPAGRLRTAAMRALSIARRHVYSLELYKKVYLTLVWKVSGSIEQRRRLEHLATEESLLSSVSDVSALPQQQLTPFDRMSDEQVAAIDCVYGMKPNPDTVPAIRREPGFPAWIDAVRGFQRLNREGRYHVVFFANQTPPVCPDGDVFYDGGTKAVDSFLMSVMEEGTDAISTYDAFLHVHPTQMPNAVGHSLGNSNVVKAEVLFEFLRERVRAPSEHP
jgi:hypothetical protein